MTTTPEQKQKIEQKIAAGEWKLVEAGDVVPNRHFDPGMPAETMANPAYFLILEDFVAGHHATVRTTELDETLALINREAEHKTPLMFVGPPIGRVERPRDQLAADPSPEAVKNSIHLTDAGRQQHDQTLSEAEEARTSPDQAPPGDEGELNFPPAGTGGVPMPAREIEGLPEDRRSGLPAGAVVSLSDFNPDEPVDEINLPFGVLATSFLPDESSHVDLVELDLDLSPLYEDNEWVSFGIQEVEQVLGVIPAFNPEGVTDTTASLIESVQWRDRVEWEVVRSRVAAGEPLEDLSSEPSFDPGDDSLIQLGSSRGGEFSP